MSAYPGDVVSPITIDGEPCEKMPLHEAIEAVIRRYPNRIALSYKTTQLTYSGLDRAATAMALMLASQNVGHTDSVAILMHRTDKMIVSLLAILRLGAAYIPIDPRSPDERVAFILQDTDAQALILGAESNYDCTNLEIPVFYESGIPVDENEIASQTQELSQIDIKPSCINPKMEGDDLAYIIYTSGSTGQPKGVKVTHANVQNHAYWARLEFGMTEKDVVDFSTTMAFDIAVGSTILPLLCGAKIEICPENIRELPQHYLAYLSESDISIITLTPSYFAVLRQALDNQPVKLSLNAIWLAGEALIPSDIKAWLAHFPDHIFINEYGPTETTIGIFTYKILDGNPYLETASVPIGTPAYNSTAYILDENQCLCAEGESGELCIAGKSVSAGYLNRPDLNSKLFIDDQFSSEGKLYRTGDLVRMLDDGNMVYLGRLDRQIKIRGFRIEPGEIEAVVLELKAVKSVAVFPYTDDNGAKLVAYLILHKGAAKSVFELRQFLKSRLPDYMLPNHFLFLDEFPVTVNGKLDKSALPLPNDIIRGSKNIAPETELEKAILEIWVLVLKNNHFGVTDDFFLIGGESLNAAQIIQFIEKKFSINLSLQSFYAHPNVRSIAAYIDQKTIEIVNEDTSLLEALSQIEEMSELEIGQELKK